METKQDKSVWLRNSVGNLAGIVSATPSKNERVGWLTMNLEPMSVTLDLSAEQMRALAAELEAAASVVEQREALAA